MLTTEIKINGVLIGHLYVVNRVDINEEGTLYECFYTRMDGSEQCKFAIRHHYDDGAEVLVSKVMKRIVEEENGSN